MVATIIVLAIILAFGLGAWRGAPYVPILRRPATEVLALTELKAGQTLIDLGSGDGRLLKLAARQGIRGIGYEINPWLWLISIINCWPYRRLVTIHLADFWFVKLPPVDAITVFLIERYMGRLERKLEAEVAGPTVVVSYVFALPKRRPELTTKNSYRYRYQNKKNA